MKQHLRVVGLDLSLRSTGMSDGHVTSVVQTESGGLLEARMDQIFRAVSRFVAPVGAPAADLVVIEGASYGSNFPGSEELAALRLMVRHSLWRAGVPYALVPPKTLKLHTAGTGYADKTAMVTAVDGRHGTCFAAFRVKDGRYDRADAFALSSMGYDHVGQPLEGKPPRADVALARVVWPALVSDD